MQDAQKSDAPIVVIGAGIGGLSAALRLAAQGQAVTVLERHDHVGGKMRSVPSKAGPVDAGPTVLTMRHVFEDLFASAGERLEDHLVLNAQHVLARHFWSDGSTLDLFSDPATSIEAVERFCGEGLGFKKFSERAARLFHAFEAPMMNAAAPNQMRLTLDTLKSPALLRAMTPLSTLAKALERDFSDPRLRQLFGRYATYVGGSPYLSPALLSLIWHAEAAGVWTVHGGMHRVAQVLADLITAKGGQIRTGTHVRKIEFQHSAIHAVVLDDGERVNTSAVLFNGDPKAIAEGRLGPTCQSAVQPKAVENRSLSAYVWSFAAHAHGADLAHHNVFFGDTAQSEFDDLASGQMPSDPTLYICAQDRDDGGSPPGGTERFEIIMNGPPGGHALTKQEFETCRTRTFTRLKDMGLRFSPEPDAQALMTPAGFDQMFPASDGSLYGLSPHGMTSALRRPRARTPIKGLYLAGGGVHPGPGIPMAALSGKHAAEAILQDRISTSTSHQTGMPGGISTGSATMAAAPSRSSAS